MSDNKRVVRFSLLYGFSLIIEYVNIFYNYKDVTFVIQFNRNLIKELRGNYDQEYFNLQYDILLTFLKHLDNVIVDDGENYEYVLPHILISNLGGNNNSLKLFDYGKYYQFENPSIIDSYGKYIILNTKIVSGVDIDIRSIWVNNKERLFQIINDSNVNVLLIGEKDYENCSEYELHNTFSIYKDIVDANLKNLIDITANTTQKLYELDYIKRNLFLLKNSLFNIHFGDGGGLKVFAYLNNLHPFTSMRIHSLEYINSPYFCKLTYDINLFLCNVEQSLKI